jgi:transcriptional regulator with XRE-family HTH domain
LARKNTEFNSVVQGAILRKTQDMKEKDLKRLFGLRVQQLRRLKRLTQEELADAIGRSVDTVSNIERGFSSTRLETAAHLAKALDVTLPELFEFSITKDMGRTHRRELEKLFRLLSHCPPKRLSALAKIIEQAVQLTGDPL